MATNAAFMVQNATGGSVAANSTTAVWGSNTTSGNFIFVLVGTTSTTVSSVTSVTDTQGNTYTSLLTDETSGNLGDVEVWYAKNILGGTTPTITVNLNALLTSAVIAREYYGIDTVNPINKNNGTAIGSSNAPTSNAIITTQAPSLLVGVMGQVGITGTISLGSGWSNLTTKSNGNEVAIEDQCAYYTGSATAVFALTLSLQWNCAIVSLNWSPHGTTTSVSSTSISSTSSSTSSTSSSISSTSTSLSTSSTSTSLSITTLSTSSTSSSVSSTSISSTSSSTSISSTSSSISSTSISSTSTSSTSTSISISSTSSSISSTSSSISSTSVSTSSTSFSSTSSSSSTSTTTVPPPYITYSYNDLATYTVVQQFAFQSPSTWVAPAGVTSVIAECWGGGGSAGAAASGTTVGDGGGGGAYSQKTIAVTAGTSYTIIVGAGGASVSGASAGNPGQDTSFVNSATLLAKAGAGGQGGGVGGGAGGNKASGVGTITTSGGAGAIGSANNGGGGGSSGGSGGDGISPSAAGTTGGNPGPTNNTYSNGAYGGNSSTGGNGSPGKPAGGGGGGPTGGSTSGAGGAGMVQLTYTVTNPPTTNTNLFLENAVQYANDSVDDGDYFITYGSEYVIRELKRTFTNNTNIPNCSIKIRSTEASITSPILLQVYNVNSSAWETIASQTLKPADTDFVLQGAPTGTVANYYDSTNTVSFRVYQQVV